MSDPVENVTSCADHETSSEELGYTAKIGWADRMTQTHQQRRCGECGLYKIWILR